ncbi:MAG: hypothetical protein AB8B55_10855 [Mariniblastus sp.]
MNANQHSSELTKPRLSVTASQSIDRDCNISNSELESPRPATVLKTRAGLLRTKRSSRRGITLLFVVTMLLLFLLMGTAFVIVSNDFFRSAKKRSQKHFHVNDGQALVEHAFYDLLRGPALTNASSPLRGHSLLADMYGYGFKTSVVSATADSSQHFIKLVFRGDGRYIIDGTPIEATTTHAGSPKPIPRLLSGLVLSVVSGPASGMSGRIIDHLVEGDSTTGYTHSVILFPSRTDKGFTIGDASVINNHLVVINGRPFSGTGAGFHTQRTSRDQASLSNSAVEPNQAGRTLSQMLARDATGYFAAENKDGERFSNSMGPNESYDAFDFQNMFLGGLRRNGSISRASFYRRELSSQDRWDFRAFNQVPVRPITPVTGIQTTYTETDNNDDSLDSRNVVVDNNNDGKPDGIWMDVGLPVQTRADGVCVKPLVSYLVLDMDGRINVNAHGSLLRDDDHRMSEIDFLGVSDSSFYKRGQGYGTPEISMVELLGLEAGNMLTGGGGRPGRYGVDGVPGEPGVRDSWSGYKLIGYPDAPFNQDIPGTVDWIFGSAMDVHGRFAVGYPQIFEVSDNRVPIGMPVASVEFSDLANEITDSPYEFSFVDGGIFRGAVDRGFDAPFSAPELEAVLRRYDPDSQLLADRLLVLGNSAFSRPLTAANSVTTHSFEVPTTFENLPEKLYDILIDNGVSESDVALQLQSMLPPEVFRGLPMNVNRVFGDGVDNNDNGVIDEIGENDVLMHPTGQQVEFDHDNDSLSTGDGDTYLARINFARNLYIVTLLATERVDRNGDGRVDANDWYDFNADDVTNSQDLIDYRRMVAQWSANVVDFRDRDYIMTPFEVDLNPWNGWDVDNNIGTPETITEGGVDMRRIVWGAERPELLISETFATHDRRTQDLEIELMPDGEDATKTTDIDNPDEDLDSHLVPKPAAFFELYNPWVMNDANQARSTELYDEDLGGVELQKTSPDGSSPVWRLLVTDTGQEDLDPDDPTQNEDGEQVTGIRRIYFARPTFNVDDGPEVFFPADDVTNVGSVGPGRYAIIGTAGSKVGNQYHNYFGRRSTAEALEDGDLNGKTRRISLNPTSQQLEILQWNKDTNEPDKFLRSVVTLPIGLNDGGWERDLGVSDPVQGYFEVPGPGGAPIGLEQIVDGWKFTEEISDPDNPTDFAFDVPADKIVDEEHYNDFLADDGLKPGYRTVHLQRLANPMLPFNETTNPYRTVDSSSMDLFVYNGAEPAVDPLNQAPTVMRFGTYERRSDDSTFFGQTGSRHRLMFKNDRLGRQNAVEYSEDEFNGTDSHIFSWNFRESLGGLNAAYHDDEYLSNHPDEQKPFCWLTWNNRPFASQMELANVPFTSSYWMTRLFNIGDSTRNVYQPPRDEDFETEARNYTAHFPHLLNFYADELESGGDAASLHRVFDYLEVPSRFVGTESYVNPTTFANDSHGVSYGLAAPFDKISNYRYPGKININTVLDPMVWNGLMGFYATDDNHKVDYLTWDASRRGDSSVSQYGNPYRPAISNNRVPAAAGDVVNPADCGLFRANPDDDEEPLFDYNPNPSIGFADDNRAAYFKYDMRQRLGNLVTSRSSVFGVWVTVGYFEVNPDGGLKLRTGSTDPRRGTGFEGGADTGEAIRHRGFFLVDRSVPVAFEPGKNHNVDRAVLVKTIND